MNLTVMANEVAKLLSTRKERVVFAESCTGGLLCATLAQVPGISEHLCGSFVTYRRESKEAWLHVSNQTVLKHTCESLEVAEEMVKGAFEQCVEADWAVSVVGHFGPGAPEDKDGKIYVVIARWHAATAAPNFQDPEIEIVQRLVHHLTVENRIQRQRFSVEYILTHFARCLIHERIAPEKIRLHSDFTSKYRDEPPNKSEFVRYFSHAAGEFADEEWEEVIDDIAKHEGKTHQQVLKEIKGHYEARKAPDTPHPFQTWGSLELLSRINASRGISDDLATENVNEQDADLEKQGG